jgi:hypothetical protein
LTQPAQSAGTATAAMHKDSDNEDNGSDHQKLGQCHAMWQQTWSCFLVLRMTGPEHISTHTATPFHGVTASLLSVFVKTDE